MKVKGDEKRYGRDGPSLRCRRPAAQILAMTTAPKFHIKDQGQSRRGNKFADGRWMVLQ